ncbi:MAG TPA: RES domain-containing protein [Gammaproteobacteria bacterium]|nr:RES domain-containing protein [Gammaproteobacteria bacterium]
MGNYSDTFVCHQCIGEEFLKEEVRRGGEVAQCSFCEQEAESMAIEELGEQVHEVIESYFYLTPSEPEGHEYMLAKEGLWERDGQPVDELIQDIVGVEPDVSAEVNEYLSGVYDAWGKDALMEDQPYDSEAQYAEKKIDTFEFSANWSSFKHDIRAKSRYFNRHAKNVLDQIFQNLETLVTHEGDSVIQEIPTNNSEHALYRARVALSHDDLEKIVYELPESLGAPPHQYAESGRMNASGIAVFYGALDIETCITEVRAPVGSSVVVGYFHPVRPLRILNLNQLQKVHVTGSFFDPSHLNELSRAHFLKLLVDELSLPVMPGSEERDYLPTQFVAEYLAQLDGLNLDGVMFNSSQVSGDGQNVVLFNHACGLEPYKLPKGTKVDVSFGWGSPDDYDPTITIWENVPSEQEEPKEDEAPLGFPSSMFHDDILSDIDDEGVYQKETVLRLDIEGVKVHEVKGVKYDCDSIDVNRHRSEKKEYDF